MTNIEHLEAGNSYLRVKLSDGVEVGISFTEDRVHLSFSYIDYDVGLQAAGMLGVDGIPAVKSYNIMDVGYKPKKK